MFDIILTKQAKKVLKKLSKKNQEHIISILERTRIRPHSYFVRLVGKKVYKARAGDYRIIAEIHNNELIILVIKFGHRKNIYK